MARHIDTSASAFAAFYDRTVVVRGKRDDGAAISQTVEACVFEDGFDDAFADESVGTERRGIEVLIPVYAWRGDTPPRVGDLIEVYADTNDKMNYSTFRIRECNIRIGDWDIKAREVVTK